MSDALSIEWTAEHLAAIPPRRGAGVPLIGEPGDGKELFALASAMGVRDISAAARAVIKTGKVDTIAVEAEAGPLAYFAQRRGCDLGAEERAQVAARCVDRWVQAFGTAGTLDVLAALQTPPKIHHTLLRNMIEDVVVRLRRWLAHAPDYERALARAKQLLAGFTIGADTRTTPPFSTLPVTEVLAFLFPEHRPFFAAALEHARKADWRTTLLFGAATTPEEVTQVWATASVHAQRHAIAVPDAVGVPGFAPLAAHEYPGEGLALALSAYVGPAAADAVARQLAKTEARPIVRRYFEQHPELAKAALAKLAGPPALRNAAQKLLAGIGTSRTPKPAKPAAAKPPAPTAAAGPAAVSIGTFAMRDRCIVLMDSKTAPAWSQDQHFEKALAVGDGTLKVAGALAVLVDPGACDASEIWATEGGIAFCEFYPKAGIRADSPETLAALGRYVAQLPAARAAKRVGAIDATSGCIVALLPQGEVRAKALASPPKRTARIVKASNGFPLGAIIPVTPGRYDVFVERVGGGKALATEIGRIDRRVRIVRRR